MTQVNIHNSNFSYSQIQYKSNSKSNKNLQSKIQQIKDRFQSQINRQQIQNNINDIIQPFQKNQIPSSFQNHNIIENQIIKKFESKRKDQFLFSYFLGIIAPITTSTIIMTMLILSKNDIYRQKKSWVSISLTIFTFTYYSIQTIIRFGFIKYIKNYLCPDRLVPGIISSTFAYFAMTKTSANTYKYQKWAQITFTIWLFSIAGNLRVCLKEYNWSKWQIFLSKITFLYCGIALLYGGFTYIYEGKSLKYPAKIRALANDLILLFLFASVDTIFQFYRFISKFDGTQELKSPIEFILQEKMNNEIQDNKIQILRNLEERKKQVDQINRQ